MFSKNVLAALTSLLLPLCMAAQEDSAALVRQAESYRQRGELDGAEAAYRRAVEADPKNVRALLPLALILDGNGKREEASALYQRVLGVEAENPIALNNLAYLMAEAGKDLDAALEMAQKARRQWPEMAELVDTVGWILIKKNLGKDAVTLYGPVVVENPENGSYHYHFGIALLQTGDKAGAARELKLATENDLPVDDDRRARELLKSLN
ncbi:MAG TPA: tetratricopeptide repeat protein [Bryobacteraceae bacterium]|jgi:Flp pilus assembly protein TadD